MKRTLIKRIGKKGKAWIKDRRALIKEAVAEGVLRIVNGQPYGLCGDCQRMKILTPDHRKKRSQGGSNDKSNIDWVCLECHNMRDNKGDPNKKKETSTKKPDWMKTHVCKNCKARVSTYICSYCGKESI